MNLVRNLTAYTEIRVQTGCDRLYKLTTICNNRRALKKKQTFKLALDEGIKFESLVKDVF